MPSVLAGALTDANTVGRQAVPPHRLRTRGKTFLRSVGTVPTLRAVDGTSSGHGVSLLWWVAGGARLVSQEPFVWVTVAIELASGAADPG